MTTVNNKQSETENRKVSVELEGVIITFKKMSGGRFTWFIMGMATGSLCYYATDTTMLSQAGKAEKRAGEIREELIGYVATPVKEIATKVKNVVLSPLQEQVKEKLSAASALTDTDLKSTWNKGVQEAFGAVSSLVSGGDNKSS